MIYNLHHLLTVGATEGNRPQAPGHRPQRSTGHRPQTIQTTDHTHDKPYITHRPPSPPQTPGADTFWHSLAFVIWWCASVSLALRLSKSTRILHTRFRTQPLPSLLLVLHMSEPFLFLPFLCLCSVSVAASCLFRRPPAMHHLRPDHTMICVCLRFNHANCSFLDGDPLHWLLPDCHVFVGVEFDFISFFIKRALLNEALEPLRMARARYVSHSHNHQTLITKANKAARCTLHQTHHQCRRNKRSPLVRAAPTPLPCDNVLRTGSAEDRLRCPEKFGVLNFYAYSPTYNTDSLVGNPAPKIPFNLKKK